MAAVGLFGVLALRPRLLRARLFGTRLGGARRRHVLMRLRLAVVRLGFGAGRPLAVMAFTTTTSATTVSAVAALALRRPAFARLSGGGRTHPGDLLAGQPLDRGH